MKLDFQGDRIREGLSHANDVTSKPGGTLNPPDDAACAKVTAISAATVPIKGHARPEPRMPARRTREMPNDFGNPWIILGAAKNDREATGL